MTSAISSRYSQMFAPHSPEPASMYSLPLMSVILTPLAVARTRGAACACSPRFENGCMTLLLSLAAREAGVACLDNGDEIMRLDTLRSVGTSFIASVQRLRLLRLESAPSLID